MSYQGLVKAGGRTGWLATVLSPWCASSCDRWVYFQMSKVVKIKKTTWRTKSITQLLCTRTFLNLDGSSFNSSLN